MQFKYPELLYFLLTLIIPILIHLFQLRKFKKTPFTNVAFLKKLELQTRKSSKLKKYLVLLSRLLAFTFLILAFTQPFLSKTNEIKEVNNLIYLDNSLSMNAKDKTNVSLFQSAIQQIIKSTTDKTNLDIFTNDDSFFNLSGKEIKSELLSLQTNSESQDISSVLLKIKKHFSAKKQSINNVILVSDFQNETSFKLDSTLQYHFVKILPNSVNNLSIDSVYIKKQVANNITLGVDITNHGNLKDNVAVSIFKEDILLGKSSIDLTTKKLSTSFTIPFQDSFNGTIKIKDNHLKFDNTFYFSLNKTKKISVLAIGKNSNFLKRIYTSQEFNFKSSKLNGVDYTTLKNYNTIVLNELEVIPLVLQKELKTFVQKGGSLVIIPKEKIDVNSYHSLFTSFKLGQLPALVNKELVVNQLHTKHAILNDVFEKKVQNFSYPFVKSYFPLQINHASNIVSLQNNIGFIQQKNLQKGKIYWFAGAINAKNSNLTSNSLIVPLFYNFAKQSFKIVNLYNTIGKTVNFEVKSESEKEEIIEIKSNNYSFIPLQKVNSTSVEITTTNYPVKAGHYQVVKNKQILSQLAYNYNQKESETNYADLLELEKQPNVQLNNNVETTLNTIEKDYSKTELWKWFLVCSFIFLLAEMLLLKFFKTTT